jgi:hypothetical protein
MSIFHGLKPKQGAGNRGTGRNAFVTAALLCTLALSGCSGQAPGCPDAGAAKDGATDKTCGLNVVSTIRCDSSVKTAMSANSAIETPHVFLAYEIDPSSGKPFVDLMDKTTCKFIDPLSYREYLTPGLYVAGWSLLPRNINEGINLQPEGFDFAADGSISGMTATVSLSCASSCVGPDNNVRVNKGQSTVIGDFSVFVDNVVAPIGNNPDLPAYVMVSVRDSKGKLVAAGSIDQWGDGRYVIGNYLLDVYVGSLSTGADGGQVWADIGVQLCTKSQDGG